MKLFNFIYLTITLFSLVAFITPEARAFQNQEGSGNIIKIGLLVQDNKSVEAQFGAEMAIRKANENGGINGHKFQLVTRSMEGSWGTGSKQAVDLIFKENVWAIMGSHDGRNAHLVEQVSAKTRTVFLSSWASDPTLSQAFIPWYFSCVPNDNKQANAFIEEIYKKRKITKIAAIADNGYDSELALKTFVKTSKTEGKPELVQFFYDNSSQNFDKLLDQINKAGINGILLFGKPAASKKIIQKMRDKKMNQPIFGTLSLLGENEFAEVKLVNYEGVVLVNFGNLLGPKALSLQNEFQKKYDKMPGAVAAYAFDGMNIIVEAIENTGFDREKLQKSMSNINYQGVTGDIQFDDKGNRIGNVGLIEIKNGTPVSVNK
ncbi:MAG: ABC transporter substrate-binding protein [Gillisia sp.]|nr:ABC transporter substrate-binding protein [Gillisia sp.]